MSHCKIISISNCKGGCGKTSLAINMAAALSKQGKRVLLVDNDPQANCTISMGVDPQSLQNTLSKLMLSVIDNPVFTENVADYIIKLDNVDLLPSNIYLSTLENRLASAYNRENVLNTILDSIKDIYDYIFIDCLPSLGLLTINALTAADRVLIPIDSHYLAYQGLGLILDAIAHIKMKLNPNLEIEGIVFTMFQSRTKLCQSILDAVITNYGKTINVFKICIPFSIKAAEVPIVGQSICDYAPSNPVAVSYLKLAEELIGNGC